VEQRAAVERPARAGEVDADDGNHENWWSNAGPNRRIALRLCVAPRRRLFKAEDSTAVIRKDVLEQGHLVLVVLLHGIEPAVHAFAECVK
ncbi:hypothetical protein H6B14_15815, partial [Phocaeicola coprophilus]|nr:hypothetical protein [Phocaeicola coprophilus]